MKVLTAYEMCHSKVDIHRLYVQKDGEGRGLLQTEATYKEETINTAEYLNTKYKKDSTQPNTNSTIKIWAKVVRLKQTNEFSDTTNEGIQQTKAKSRLLMWAESSAQTVH
jgi:hypothetical protein